MSFQGTRRARASCDDLSDRIPDYATSFSALGVPLYDTYCVANREFERRNSRILEEQFCVLDWGSTSKSLYGAIRVCFDINPIMGNSVHLTFDYTVKALSIMLHMLRSVPRIQRHSTKPSSSTITVPNSAVLTLDPDTVLLRARSPGLLTKLLP